jgi:anhydro-N-acetylmuramic acid kinase
MDKRFIIGLSVGSTGDGIDAVLLEVDGAGLEMRPRLMESLFQPHPRDLQDLLTRVSMPSATGKQAALVHRLLGETFAVAARRVVDQAGMGHHKVLCLGCPGFTAWHEPENRYPCTLSLGMMAIVSELTGITSVSDFRSRDLAVGGQGLPLTSIADRIVFYKPGENRVLVNLGGSASIVWLPASGDLRDIRGFQSSPCSTLLDGLMSHVTRGKETYDAYGKHAVQGRCIDELLQRWLSHPSLLRKPPKGIPRAAFGEEFISQTLEQARVHHWNLHDLLCTATHFAARGITNAIHNFLPRTPDRVILSGGGVRNGLLWRLLEQNLPGVPLETIERFGIPARARKAVGFGCLAALTLDGYPGNLPSVTGASGSRILGNLTPGSTQNWARCLNWMTQQTGALAAA